MLSQRVGANRFLYGVQEYGFGFPETPITHAHIISQIDSPGEYVSLTDVWALHIGGRKKQHPRQFTFRKNNEDIGSLIIGRTWGVVERIHDFSPDLLVAMKHQAEDSQVKYLFLPMNDEMQSTAEVLGFERFGELYGVAKNLASPLARRRGSEKIVSLSEYSRAA